LGDHEYKDGDDGGLSVSISNKSLLKVYQGGDEAADSWQQSMPVDLTNHVCDLSDSHTGAWINNAYRAY
jgi:hypothetical protein